MQVNCIHVSTVQIELFDIKSLISDDRNCQMLKKLVFSSNVAIFKFKSVVKFMQAD